MRVGIRRLGCWLAEIHVTYMVRDSTSGPSSDSISVDGADVPPSSDAPPSPVHIDHQNAADALTAGSRQTYWESIAAIYQEKTRLPQDLSLKVNSPSVGAPTERGTLVIPGWVRELAAEVLFEGGHVDESSVAKVMLDYLMRVGHSILFGSSMVIYDWVSGSTRSAEGAYLLHSYRWWDCNATWGDTSATTGASQNCMPPSSRLRRTLIYSITLIHHHLLPPLLPIQAKPRHSPQPFSPGSASPSPGESFLALLHPVFPYSY